MGESQHVNGGLQKKRAITSTKGKVGVGGNFAGISTKTHSVSIVNHRWRVSPLFGETLCLPGIFQL